VFAEKGCAVSDMRRARQIVRQLADFEAEVNEVDDMAQTNNKNAKFIEQFS